MPEQNPQTQPRPLLLSRRDLQHLREVIDERVRAHGTAAETPLTCAEVRLLIDQAGAAADAGSAPAASAWVPVAERLPQSSTPVNRVKVLVWVPAYEPGNRVQCGYWFGDFGEWQIVDSPSRWEVTHWMPLPEPPSEAAAEAGETTTAPATEESNG